MDNFEKDMQKLVLDLLTKQVHGPGTSEEKIDDQNATQVKQDDQNGNGSTSTTTVAEEKLDLCPVCQTKADKTCGGCKAVSYCSIEHQRLDWKAHKKCCSPFIIQETGTIGKGWIATRDLPANTILLDELPALCAPKWTHLDSPCCVACGVGMIKTVNKDRKCSTCSWSICSDKCEKSSSHTENECKLFPLHKKKLSAVLLADHFCFQLLVLRASNLKLKNRQVFDKLMELQDFQDIPYDEDLQKKCNIMFTIYKNSYFGLQQYNLTDEECEKLRRISWVNSFQYTVNKQLGGMSLLYLQSSRMNHSCAPNCVFTEGTPPDFKMRVRTAVPVKKGESLTIPVLDTIYLLQPTSIRNELLAKHRGFVCKCERCLDPTELGTFVSGIKCQKCRVVPKNNNAEDDENVGYFLPENPLDISVDSRSEPAESNPLFQCNGCGEKKLFSLLKSSLPSEIQRAFDIDANGVIENPGDFLSKYENGGNYLHKNHYLILICVHEMAFRPTKSMNKVELQETLRQMEILLKIQNQMFPGLSRSKVDLLFHIVMIGSSVLRRFSPQMSPDEIQKLLFLVKTCYKGALEHFKKDNSADGEWMVPDMTVAMGSLGAKFFL